MTFYFMKNYLHILQGIKKSFITNGSRLIPFPFSCCPGLNSLIIIIQMQFGNVVLFTIFHGSHCALQFPCHISHTHIFCIVKSFTKLCSLFLIKKDAAIGICLLCCIKASVHISNTGICICLRWIVFFRNIPQICLRFCFCGKAFKLRPRITVNICLTFCPSGENSCFLSFFYCIYFFCHKFSKSF